MNHSQVRARLNDHLDRTLSPEHRARVAAHLAECSECAGELRELQATVSLLRRLPEVEPPPALAASVMARVRAGEAEPRRLFDWLRRITEPALALPLAGAMAALAVFVAGERGAVPAAPEAGARLAALENADARRLPEFVAVEPAPSAMLAADLRRSQLARDLRRLARLEQISAHEAMRRALQGAGHPHAPSFVTQLDASSDSNLALASFSRRRR